VPPLRDLLRKTLAINHQWPAFSPIRTLYTIHNGACLTEMAERPQSMTHHDHFLQTVCGADSISPPARGKATLLQSKRQRQKNRRNGGSFVLVRLAAFPAGFVINLTQAHPEAHILSGSS